MWFWKNRAAGKKDRSGKRRRDGGREDLDPVASLKEAGHAAGLTPDQLFLSILFEPGRSLAIDDRRLILVGDGHAIAEWPVASLRELFRGTRQPPSEKEMERYPEQYVPFFYRIEYNVYRCCRTMEWSPVDSEFVDLYTQMRRRPDGRSLGPLHDIIWQSAALVLGLRPWSEAEYTAVFRQLARSARHFKMGPASRNYIQFVNREVGGEGHDADEVEDLFV